MLAGTFSALLAVVVAQAPETARAESLLAAGSLPQARAIAERLVAASPGNSQYHILLGRIWLAWPVVGRYEALARFRTAARLAPNDPDPLYRQMEVGFYLGSDEGEVVARDALISILGLDPDYRDTWARFRQLFRNNDIARRADQALARHRDHPTALERRAELAVAMGEPARADSLAAERLARWGGTAQSFLLRAEAAFLRGRDSMGQVWYDSALTYIARDSTEALWAFAWTIASPVEAAVYAETTPEDRRGFLERFWSQRDPNLLTPLNERLGEHFRRTAEARQDFRLLHPFRMVYRSRTARALADFERRRTLADVVAGPGFQSLQDVAHEQAYRAGLDARGLMFVRHGRPDLMLACSPDPLIGIADPGCTSSLDSEGWLYRTPDGPRSVSFEDAEYFDPLSARQLQTTHQLMSTDHSALPAPLTVEAVTAFFAGAEPDATAIYVRTERDSAVLVLWDTAGTVTTRTAGRRLMRTDVTPGTYAFGLDVDSAGQLGRLRAGLVVPDFATGDLVLSSLVLGIDAADSDRAAALRSMPPDLTFAAGTALGSYVEAYGLTPVDGAVRYRARYTFAPERSLIGRLVRGAAPVSFEFERRAAAGGVVVERLQLEPGRVPPGRYRVTVSVTDLERNVKSESVAVVVTLR